MRILAALIFGLVSISSFAGSDPFNLLKKMFEDARPAEISEYPKLSSFKNNDVSRMYHCVETSDRSIKPTILRPAIIGRYEEVIQGATGNGPLFPGSDNSVITKISMSLEAPNEQYRDTFYLQYLKENNLFNETFINEMGDLVTLISSPEISGSYLEFNLRVSGDLLVYRSLGFLVDSNNSRDIKNESYGYCY